LILGAGSFVGAALLIRSIVAGLSIDGDGKWS
jgi:hypothetical protein